MRRKMLVEERHQAFQDRKQEPLTWADVADDYFSDIETTGFTSPRAVSVPRKKEDGLDSLKWYDPAREFGFTDAGVFVHARQIVEGTPREGARVVYSVVETEKGRRATNVCVVS